MAKPPLDDLTETKRIAARMLAMPPQLQKDEPKHGKAKPGKPAKRTTGKGRARVGKAKS